MRRLPKAGLCSVQKEIGVALAQGVGVEEPRGQKNIQMPSMPVPTLQRVPASDEEDRKVHLQAQRRLAATRVAMLRLRPEAARPTVHVRGAVWRTF